MRKKKTTSPEYEEAKRLSTRLKELYKDIAIIDKTIAEMQVDKAEAELTEGVSASALWRRYFTIVKKKETKSYFAEPNNYYDDESIQLTEPELVMLRGFKQELINKYNDEISMLSAKINED